MSDAYADMWAQFAEHLDRAVEGTLAEIPPQPPPKPFDLADLKRLAAEVDAMRPEWDRMVCAPDVVDRLRLGSAPGPRFAGPSDLWATPVVVDEAMPPGSWELRCGDRVVRGSEGPS